MSDVKDTFNGIAEAFEMNNEFNMPEEVKQFQDKKTALVSSAEKRLIEDKEFLQEEIKFMIGQGKMVLDKIQKDLKVGSQPRMFEVYGSVYTSVMNAMRELRELNKNVADVDIKTNPNQQKSTNVQMTASELSKLIKSTSKELEIKKLHENSTEVKTEKA